MRDQDGNVKKSLKERFLGLADKVPGLGDYLGREKMRDQDRILRTHTAEQITQIKMSIDDVKRELLSQGKLGLLDDLEGLTRKLDHARDTHRFEAYGFTGLFDPNQVMEDELGQLYDADEKILSEVERVREMVSGIGAGATEDSVKQALPMLRQTIQDLLNLVLARKDTLKKLG